VGDGSNGIKSRTRLKLVRRSSTLQWYSAPQSAMEVPGDDGHCSECLISSSDAVISRRLQEQTRVVLATLTPRERLVLRLRFGIAQTGNQPQEKIDDVLTPDQIAFIEATALRKLRHPSQAARLRSVERR
jgi:DNA-directed RNA polymerase sigma subunit (sigma70/sigma32)